MYNIHNPYQNEIYDEEPQQLDIRFAFVTQTLPDTITTLHNFVKCRDFLSDIIFWKKIKTYDKSLYRFKLDPNNFPLIGKQLAIKANRQHIENIITNCAWGTIGHFSTQPTKNPEITIVNLPTYFEDNPPSISFNTLLLKTAAVFDYKRQNPKTLLEYLPSKERNYIERIGLDFWIFLVQNQNKLYPHLLQFTDPNVYSWDTTTIHEYLGIVSMFTPHSPDSNAKQYYQALKQQQQNNAKTNKNKTSRTLSTPPKPNMAAVNPFDLFQANLHAIPDE